VTELNALLEAYPVQPRISGHDASDWHMHVTSRGASASAEYLAGAVWGLSVWLCSYGSERFGVCADERCGNVYLDTSSNNCRRFCSERCATRSHVAAHRARKRATLAAVTS
jgi:predicted RNA-binding Zn ribbon-like protein